MLKENISFHCTFIFISGEHTVKNEQYKEGEKPIWIDK